MTMGGHWRGRLRRRPGALAGMLACLLAAVPAQAQSPEDSTTYLTHEAFLQDVVPYDTLGFTVINPTVPPVPDLTHPDFLHYPEMTFGPVVVDTPSTTPWSFGFHTTDNFFAVFGDTWPWQVLDGNALLPGPGNTTYEQGLRFTFSIDFEQPVTALGAYFGTAGEVSPCCVRQLLHIEFWDGGVEDIDVDLVRGIEQANDEFLGYASPGRPIRSVTFFQNGNTMLLDNFVYGWSMLVPDARVIRLSGDLSFDTVPPTGSDTRVLRIYNDGTAALTIAGITYPAGFSGPWSGVIPPSEYEDVIVTFLPATGGVYSGTVTVDANHTSGINTLAAFGLSTVFEPRVIALTGDLAFGTVPVGLTAQRTLRISNLGTDVLTVAGISYPTGFSGAWSGPIAPGGFRDVVVTFAPPLPLIYAVTVTVSADDTSGTNTIQATGYGTGTVLEFSGDLNFGPVPVGTSATRTLRIDNRGAVGATATISYPWYPAYSGPSAVFVPAGGSVEVAVTFEPWTADPTLGLPQRDYTWPLTITANGRGYEVPMSGTGIYPATRLIDVTGDLSFGTVLVGTMATRTLRLANHGSETLTITGLSYPPGFSGAWSGTIPTGAVQEVTVTFAPAAEATYFGHVRVQGNHENHLSFPWETRDGGRPWRDFATALGVGSIVVTRQIQLEGDLSFGVVAVGASATRVLRIRNPGSTALTVTGITYPTGFSGAWSGTIPAGDVQDVAVTFAPSAGVAYGGLIIVAGNQTSGFNTIPTSGTGASRQIALSGDLAFGGVLAGTTATRTLRIHNAGTAALLVSGLSYSTGPFLFSGDWSGPIAAGGFQDVSVRFSPTVVSAAMQGMLTVNANQTGGTATAPYSGFGTATCRPITLGALNFTTWQVGVPFPVSVTGQSGGYTPVTFAVTSAALPDGLTITTHPWSEFSINGTPTSAGTFTFAVTATDVIGCTGTRTYTIAINGTTSAPAPFGKVSPLGGATGQPTMTTLTWQASSGAASYAYCADILDNNACDTSWVSTGTNTTAALNGLMTGRTYYWQVRAQNTFGTTYADGGSGAFWNFATSGGASTPPPPSGLHVASIVGRLVTLRWTPPLTGGLPAGYVLEGGISPGQVLASFSTGSSYPIYTFTAPTGSFFIRIRAVYGATPGPVSNEVALHVNVPVVPSTPTNLLGLVNGSTLDLTWKSTFGGGAPTGMMLDVSGAANVSLPVDGTERFTFGPVPNGTYTFQVRHTNAGGASAPSTPITLSFPVPCSGAPQAPTNFLGYRIGNTVHVIWDPPAAGPAPTQYVLDVSGAYTGQLVTTGRALGGVVSPGEYTLRVMAANPCGASAITSPQVVTVP